MVDTINLTILNAKFYAKTINQLQTLGALDKTQIQTNTPIAHNSPNTWLALALYADSDSVVAINKRSFYRSPSSTYQTAFSINYVKDTIEFNISLPKYTMKTNVFQFVDYYNINEYTTFKLFIKFLYAFVRWFPDKIHPEDMAITRIDLCYNQIFNCYADSKSYLRELEKNLKSKVLKPGNLQIYGDSGIGYLTTEGYFKIYHKGDEFKKHDARELIKYPNIDIKHLQAIADRTLRYETTIRNRKLKRLFQSDIASHIWSENVMYKDSGFIPTYFTIKPTTNQIRFNDELFSYLWNQFINTVISIQTVHNETKEMIFQRIRDTVTLNNRLQTQQVKEIGIQETAMLSFFVDIKEVYKAGFIKRSTYYDKKKMLKKMGLKTFNSQNTIIVPPIDYYNYKLYLGYLHHLII